MGPLVSELHLVTGGAGYFGEILVRRLADRRDTRVRIFDINEARRGPAGGRARPGGHPRRLGRRSGAAGASVVHHNVAMVPLAKDARAFSSVNVGGTRKLLDACWREGPKVVYVSSSAVFGAPSSNPVTERDAPNPPSRTARQARGEKAVPQHVSEGST